MVRRLHPNLRIFVTTTMNEIDRKRFRESLRRSTANDQFLDRFYDRFVGQSDEVAAFFHNRDMPQIKQKLLTTLEMLADTTEGQPGLGMYMEMLGKIHRRLNVEPRFFAGWRKALVETVAECDSEFSEETRLAWERAIDHVIERMSDPIS